MKELVIRGDRVLPRARARKQKRRWNNAVSNFRDSKPFHTQNGLTRSAIAKSNPAVMS